MPDTNQSFNSIPYFNASAFIRDSVNVSFEERPVTIYDWEGDQVYTDFVDFKGLETASFLAKYPDFQAKYIDSYVMRRPVIDVTGHQECFTGSVQSNVIADYLDADAATVKDMLISGGWGGTVPDGKYILTAFSINDRHNSISVVTLSYRQYLDWQRIKTYS